ncbi:hypothetical protein GCM10018793_49220 [Streptomyces sulfonofaciens]|uniref:Uncharacterized protein n=1 Tax=Streptomyces sulfonofaciens TaxID=68272 RepID=A0A919GHJ6_9ACTN|nr:hypothetical protein GCM10018793_49220 [Streptomyces sulfonofaciens]
MSARSGADEEPPRAPVGSPRPRPPRALPSAAARAGRVAGAECVERAEGAECATGSRGGGAAALPAARPAIPFKTSGADRPKLTA